MIILHLQLQILDQSTTRDSGIFCLDIDHIDWKRIAFEMDKRILQYLVKQYIPSSLTLSSLLLFDVFFYLNFFWRFDILTLAFLVLKVTLSKAILDAMDHCKQSFVKKDVVLVAQEIDAFVFYHDNVITYTLQMDAYQEELRALGRKKMEVVEEFMQDFGRGVLMDKEEKIWSWLPFCAILFSDPIPFIISRLFEHKSIEFETILPQMTEKGKKIGEVNDLPQFVKALKLLSRNECSKRMPMLCQVKGLTQKKLCYDCAPHIYYAIEELKRFGSLYFPCMD